MSYFTTDYDVTIADAYDFLTAVDSNSPVEAARYWQDGPEKNAEEARENDWSLKGDWSEVWDEVLDRIAERYHEQNSSIMFGSGQKGVFGASVGRATVKDCRAYLLAAENDGDWVDGEVFGKPGKVARVQ